MTLVTFCLDTKSNQKDQDRKKLPRCRQNTLTRFSVVPLPAFDQVTFDSNLFPSFLLAEERDVECSDDRMSHSSFVIPTHFPIKIVNNTLLIRRNLFSFGLLYKPPHKP
jgi:hypothetical protein